MNSIGEIGKVKITFKCPNFHLNPVKQIRGLMGRVMGGCGRTSKHRNVNSQTKMLWKMEYGKVLENKIIPEHWVGGGGSLLTLSPWLISNEWYSPAYTKPVFHQWHPDHPCPPHPAPSQSCSAPKRNKNTCKIFSHTSNSFIPHVACQGDADL